MPESTVPRRPIHGLHPTCCPRYLYPSHPTGSGDSQQGHWSCPPFVLLFRLASATGKQKKSTVIKFNRRQANFEEVQRPPGATRKRIRRTRAPCFSAAALLAELAILFILGPIAGSACAPKGTRSSARDRRCTRAEVHRDRHLDTSKPARDTRGRGRAHQQYML